MNTRPFVSVIIPAYNAQERISHILDQLKNQTYGEKNFEIILVDNNSCDKTAIIAKLKGVTVIHDNEIQCSYAARNRGISVAKGEILAFLDADCIPCNDWLLAGIKGMCSKKAALAGGKIQFIISDANDLSQLYDSIVNLQMISAIKNRGVAMTANLFIQRCVFDKIGLFPEGIRSGGDIYLTAKASASGFRIVYVEEAIIKHPARSFKSLLGKAQRTVNGKYHLKKQIEMDDDILWRIKGKKNIDHLFPIDLVRKIFKNYPQININKCLYLIMLHYLILGFSIFYMIKNTSGFNKN